MACSRAIFGAIGVAITVGSAGNAHAYVPSDGSMEWELQRCLYREVIAPRQNPSELKLRAAALGIERVSGESALVRVRRSQESSGQTVSGANQPLALKAIHRPWRAACAGMPTQTPAPKPLAELAVTASPSVTAGVISPVPAKPAKFDSPTFFGSPGIEIGRTVLSEKFGAPARMMNAGRGPWVGMMRSLRHKPVSEAAARVNSWVNRWVTYREDGASGSRDSWAAAGETLRARVGDCEDIAIAKMSLLRELGIADRDLYLVIVFDKVLRRDHALLVLRSGETLLALDNRASAPLDAGLAQD